MSYSVFQRQTRKKLSSPSEKLITYLSSKDMGLAENAVIYFSIYCGLLFKKWTWRFVIEFRQMPHEVISLSLGFFTGINTISFSERYYNEIRQNMWKLLAQFLTFSSSPKCLLDLSKSFNKYDALIIFLSWINNSFDCVFQSPTHLAGVHQTNKNN